MGNLVQEIVVSGCLMLSVPAAMQVYDTAEWFTGRLYSMRMHAIDCIAIHSIDDDIDDNDDTDHHKVGDAFRYCVEWRNNSSV
jgi:hypothetical protein